MNNIYSQRIEKLKIKWLVIKWVVYVGISIAGVQNHYNLIRSSISTTLVHICKHMEATYFWGYTSSPIFHSESGSILQTV